MLSDVLKLSAAGFTIGWGPCLAYMAPILLPYIGATKKNWKEGLKAALLFSAGRLLALSLLGGVALVIEIPHQLPVSRPFVLPR